MIKEVIFDTSTGKALGVIDDIYSHPTLEVSDHYQTATRFKSVTHIISTTTIIASPSAGGALLFTDIIISSDRAAASLLELSLYDGTDKILLFYTRPIDGPVNLALPLHGAWTAWKDASIILKTIKLHATVAIGYIKLPVGLKYAEWNALR